MIAPEVEFGAAGKDETTIDATMRAAYREVAQRRRTVPEAIVLGMLDASPSVIELQLLDGGTRYALGDQVESARSEGETWKERTVAAAGDFVLLTGQAMRTQYGFASHLASDRKELAAALKIAPDGIEENAVVREAWRARRVELYGRITARSVDEVIYAIRDIQRRDEANLVCLYINSPGGSAIQALRLVQVLTGLDSQRLRTLAFVEEEARSVAALVALAANESYARPTSLLGGPGEQAFDVQDLQSMRQPIQELAATRNRDWSLLLGLLDSDLTVFRCAQPGTGAERYLCEEERAELEIQDEWPTQEALDLSEGITGVVARQYGLLTDCVESSAPMTGQIQHRARSSCTATQFHRT